MPHSCQRHPAVLTLLAGGLATLIVGIGLVTCTTDFTEHPSHECGDQVLDPGEQCDGAEMNGVALCRDLGYQGGSVHCTPTCQYDISDCIIPCGNGVIDEGELCDDGNSDTSDACPSGDNGHCQPAKCGDGYLWLGHEQCDDGNLTDGDGCSRTCMLESCGNNVIDSGEACDSGGQDTSDCDWDCTVVQCGDGHVNQVAGEQCEPEGNESADCDADCTHPVCGDNHINHAAGEECDDGNTVSGDGCSADCRSEACGNNVVDSGEACDSGGHDTTECDADCSLPLCGDNHINHAAGEECDDGNTTSGDGCSVTCRIEKCGNHVVDTGEECDEGGVDTNDCDSDCTLVRCGDGHINEAASEECDDGQETSICDSDCTIPQCGDGHVNTAAGEECDDGGNSSSCDEDCTLVECGDSFVNHVAGEDCDSGGIDVQTCDSDCTLVRCGDGHINEAASEECDDGNTSDGDGCDGSCFVETGWTCTHEPSRCATTCGDGIVAGLEQCEPPDVDIQPCGAGEQKERECGDDCQWGDWGPCLPY